MKKIKVGINGLGRIGRITLRLLQQRSEFELVAINDVNKPEHIAHLLKYDSVHGIWHEKVDLSSKGLKIEGKEVHLFSSREPLEIPWGKTGADIIFEATGSFTKFEGASKHLKSGAKKVIISAPTKEPDKIKTYVFGINHEQYEPTEDIISSASCTTNCLAPVVKVLHEEFGVEKGFMTTIHSYTNDQRLLDLGHSDPRRMRAAALNMIPTSTGAAKVVGLVIPELKGKLTGLSIRVPTPNVSLVDFVTVLKKETSVEAINSAFVEASQKNLKGILDCTLEPLVSSDFIGLKASSMVDLLSTMLIEKNLVKVLSWYDNEVGFSSRMIDLAGWVGKTL